MKDFIPTLFINRLYGIIQKKNERYSHNGLINTRLNANIYSMDLKRLIYTDQGGILCQVNFLMNTEVLQLMKK